jgi:hypothetical protein
MTEKNTYWLRDAAGDYALITGADQRDRWIPLGWAEADEPSGNEFVWARCEGIQEPARFPAQALADVWSAKGWQAAEPPSPVSPFNGDEGAPVLPLTSVTPLSGATPGAESEKPKTADAGARGKSG